MNIDPQSQRKAVLWAKRLLPAAAALLLAMVALWPRWESTGSAAVSAGAIARVPAGSAHLRDARYSSVDQHGQPFTITSVSGLQSGGDEVHLNDPKGDLLLANGAWLMVDAKQGDYAQKNAQLDLSGDAQLYRSDGTTMISDSATVDPRSGTVVSADRTHAEGPFGLLDAQGFVVLDHGTQIEFIGASHLVMNGGQTAHGGVHGRPVAISQNTRPPDAGQGPPPPPVFPLHPL